MCGIASRMCISVLLWSVEWFLLYNVHTSKSLVTPHKTRKLLKSEILSTIPIEVKCVERFGCVLHVDDMKRRYGCGVCVCAYLCGMFAVVGFTGTRCGPSPNARHGAPGAVCVDVF